MQTQTRSIGEGTRSLGSHPGALALGQTALLIVLGVAFWFVAALAVRIGSPLGFFGPVASVAAFALGIPICWLSVLFIRKVTTLGTGQTLPGIAVALVTATFCDGIALTWGRGLYGSDPNQVTYGAAWILWGVGFFLLFAYLDDYRRTRAMR